MKGNDYLLSTNQQGWSKLCVFPQSHFCNVAFSQQLSIAIGIFEAAVVSLKLSYFCPLWNLCFQWKGVSKCFRLRGLENNHVKSQLCLHFVVFSLPVLLLNKKNTNATRNISIPLLRFSEYYHLFQKFLSNEVEKNNVFLGR